MSCRRPLLFDPGRIRQEAIETDREEFPDVLPDYLTGREIPFTNRDNIRQKVLKFLLEEKGYEKDDIAVDREIIFRVEEQEMRSLVDIAIRMGGHTLMIWKCASGSVVSRERQVIASARLLEDYLVPLAVVTNGVEVELLDTASEKVIGSGFQSLPSRPELSRDFTPFRSRPVKRAKIIYEQRILSTYDAISCPVYSEGR
jgi:hypothetical protein